MKLLWSAAFRLSQAMYHLAGALLIALVLVVLASVVSRAVFGATDGAVDFTFIGGIEMVSYGLLFMVLFILPYAVSRGQVIVDLFTGTMNDRLKGVLAGVYTFGFGVLGVGMTDRFIAAAGRVAASGEVTQDLLIPLQYVYGVAAFATAVLAARGILVALQQIVEGLRNS